MDGQAWVLMAHPFNSILEVLERDQKDNRVYRKPACGEPTEIS